VAALKLRVSCRATESEQHARDVLFTPAYEVSSSYVAPESIAVLQNIPALSIADEPAAPRKPIKLKQPPEISELPPALGDDSSLERAGPKSPRLLWRADITFSSKFWSFVGVADNGCVFLHDSDGVCGVMDGKEEWAYSVRTSSDLKLTEDFRLWQPIREPYRGRYCFNARGEGGRIALPKDPFPQTSNADSVGFECRGAVAKCFRRDTKLTEIWNLQLDGNCTWNTWGFCHGDFYVATDAGTIYSISGEGSVNWTYTADSGPVHGIEVIGPGRVVFGSDARLYDVTEGKAA